MCPELVYTLTNQDGSVIDSAIFTYSPESGRLDTYSTDKLKADVYPLRIIAKFTDSFYTNSGYQDFTITVIDPCSAASIDLISSPWPIGNQQAPLIGTSSVDWNAADMYNLSTDVDCGDFIVVFSDSYTAISLNPSLFSVDQVEQMLTKLDSTDLSLVGEHRIEYHVMLVDYPSVVST